MVVLCCAALFLRCLQDGRFFDCLTLCSAISRVSLRRVLRSGAQLSLLGIREHEKKQAKDLSGGTQRKVSVGISMINSPDVCLLDEPSTGLDPQSRRVLWDVIKRRLRGTAAVLTTHSMEEAEALCNKIAIMVKGPLLLVFVCVCVSVSVCLCPHLSPPLSLSLNESCLSHTRAFVCSLLQGGWCALGAPHTSRTFTAQGTRWYDSPDGMKHCMLTPTCSHAIPHAQTPNLTPLHLALGSAVVSSGDQDPRCEYGRCA